MTERTASMPEMKAFRVPDDQYDVAILGGGLAGLALANQLMLARPETKVLVTDKRAEPAPESAFKVGESSALAVWYFHMAARHLPDPPDPQRKINPQAIGLDTSKWEAEGLFPDDGTGMSLADALELIPGVDEFDLEARGARLVEDVSLAL
jgi:flavin-dependent dehydrogenase